MKTDVMEKNKELQKEFSDELTDNILNYWIKKCYDPERRMFVGYIDHYERADPEASLGVVLISRIVWTFSRAYTFFPTAIYRKIAEEAFRILTGLFMDRQNGGVYWEVLPSGVPVNRSKQSYGQAFAIFALAEYAFVFGNEQAGNMAFELANLLEDHARDKVHQGYYEAFSDNWENRAPDFITPAGKGVVKSMNTHLHILEAYTNLYRLMPENSIRENTSRIIDLFIRHIINPETHHFNMFFGDDWSVQTKTISFGHDIEGSWLLEEASRIISDRQGELKPLLAGMAYATANEATDHKGGLYNEREEGTWDRNFHWWPQAEAVVGFYNAFQMTGDSRFFILSRNAWNFIRKFQIDHVNGEWFWLVSPEYKTKPMPKVSPWKCPYHNGRMCMDMMTRLKKKRDE
jgi:mannobiose 2-epimerase